ncbi:MAG: hypothetical protein JSR63_02910 [Proteobacteria bacterium]|nr:hypothetical protein [Pseudomonadota bacterium]MBS0217113.1 hypothetical protein [Pseudomonadota bacterium]
MSWLLLALSLAVFCVAWSVHSPLLMVLCLLAALAALIGFAWLRYKILFPERTVAIDDTPLTAEDVRRMRDAQLAATATAAPMPLPASTNPDIGQLRAAGERVAERDALLQQQEETQRRIAEMERRAAEAEQRAADMEQRLVDLQQREPQSTPIQIPVANSTLAPAETAPAPAVTPPALPPKPQPNLRDEGWNPYAGEVHVPAKRPIDPKAAGLDVPMLTPLRDEPDPT